jgi:D-glycerate 3-kinase
MLVLGSAASGFVHDFIEREQLPASYAETVRKFYGPLAQRIFSLVRSSAQVPVVGINGAQGTGKSTSAACVAGLLELRGLRVMVLSIDDLYHPKSVRENLGAEVHPLLVTRGVPGTHDMEIFKSLVATARGEAADPIAEIPRFDKGQDDRSASGTPFPAEGVDVILFEGWCIGAEPQLVADLEEPCNALEEKLDADGRWRRHVNEQLAAVYTEANELLDYLVMLKPPSFEVVYEWRGEQEAKLRRRLEKAGVSDSKAMNEAELAHFISHYERLTRWMFTEMPKRADEVFLIEEDHEVFSNVRNPKESTRYLISTDLDATLLDDTYSWDAALPALKLLAEKEAVLVLNSSKTVSEMQELAIELAASCGLSGAPLVAENGGVLAVPEKDGYRIECLGRSRADILAVAHALREAEGYDFRGFADMQPEELVELTGLSRDAATLAMDRQATEPILWNDTEERWAEFFQTLEKEGIKAVRGGRFIHLMGPTDKADGMAAALDYFQSLEPSRVWKVIALGDSPNDLGMLNAADLAVVIKNSAHDSSLQPAAVQCIFPPHEGPRGWNEAILYLLEHNE